jgi:uncharacterized protein
VLQKAARRYISRDNGVRTLRGGAPLALVTGAAGGIGRSIARELVARRFNLVLVDRDEAGLARLREEFGKQVAVETLVMDLARPDAAENVHGWVTARGIRIDFLANNVGFGKTGEHIEQDPAVIRAMLTLNNMLPFEMCLRFGQDMKANGGGTILNVASLVGFSASPYFAAYSGTKAAMIAFSIAFAREMEDHGVTVTCLCPGTTETSFLDVAAIDSEASRGMNRFASAFVADPATVAQAGVAGAIRGKMVVVPTLFLNVQAVVLDFLPATLVSGFVKRRIQRGHAQDGISQR